MKTSLALIVAATSVFVFTQAADAVVITAVVITAVVITAVVITAATIAAERSALAWAAGPVFVESTEGGIVAGGKRRGCRRLRSSWN